MALAFFFGMIGGLGIPHLKCFNLIYMRVQMTRKLAFLMYCVIWRVKMIDFGTWDFIGIFMRELEVAFSFLDFIQSRIPRGIGCDSPHWCLNGMVSLIFGPFTIRLGVLLSLASLGRVFGKSRFLKGWLSSCGLQLMVGYLPWIIWCSRVSLWWIGAVCDAIMRNLWIIFSYTVL